MYRMISGRLLPAYDQRNRFAWFSPCRFDAAVIFFGTTGVIIELSEREKFWDNFRISGRNFGPNFGFPHIFYIFSLLPQLKIGRSQPA